MKFNCEKFLAKAMHTEFLELCSKPWKLDPATWYQTVWFQQAGSKSFIFFLRLRWAPLPNQSCKILKLWQLCKLTFCPSTPSTHSHMCCIDKDRCNWAAVTVVLERKPHTSDIMDTNIVWQNWHSLR
jgi:hypothetical protein